MQKSVYIRYCLSFFTRKENQKDDAPGPTTRLHSRRRRLLEYSYLPSRILLLSFAKPVKRKRGAKKQYRKDNRQAGIQGYSRPDEKEKLDGKEDEKRTRVKRNSQRP